MTFQPHHGIIMAMVDGVRGPSDIAVKGLMRAQNDLRNAADNVANSSPDSFTVPEVQDVVNIKQAEQLFNANALTLKAASGLSEAVMKALSEENSS